MVFGYVDYGKCLLLDEKVILFEYGLIIFKGLFDLVKEIVVVDNEKEIRKFGVKFIIVGEDGRLRVFESLYVWKVRYRGKMFRVKFKNWYLVLVMLEYFFLIMRGWVCVD